MDLPVLGLSSLSGGEKQRNSKKSQQSRGKGNLRKKTDYDGISQILFGSSEQSSVSTTPSSSIFSSASSSSFTSKSKIETSSRIGLKPVMDLSKSKLATLDEPGFTATPKMGRRKLKAIRKKVKERTKGPQWFDMSAPEITDQRKNDLETLKLRGALNTKTFYKRNTVTVAPKYFHVGKVVESAQDFYASRVPKKQRKATIADELMSELRD